MKSIELTNSQLVALQNGATVLLFPVKHTIEPAYMETRERMYCNTLIERFSPLQKDDKFFVQEEWMLGIQDGAFNTKLGWTHKGNLAKIQGTTEDIKVTRVQDIDIFISAFLGWWSKDVSDFATHYNQQMKEQNINRTYKDNDYVFLVRFKR